MILKCKMCGGDLILEEEKTIIECEYCGTQQTVPSADNEKKANLFNRANRLRMSAEFDKAAGVYESIVAEFPEEAEAYWGLCLCAYGIEYVDDPETGKKIPTCHRTRAESVLESNNFEMACEYADVVARRMYRSEAREIDRLQKEILAIVANESPYDVFICYKETAEDGGRTEDSVIAQDIYDALTAKGLKVFFARITLEDKLGQQYEPYIYAALHSAKVMLAIGTCFEHFDAVWVKNEWSRFLDMMKEDRTKVLVPCYKGVDAYDIPKEMRALQAQDMGKLGFMQDLVRGVEKIVGKMPAAQSVMQPVQQVVQQTVVQQQGAGVDSLMRRAQLFLEDGDWKSANEYLNKVLDINPEYAPAYFGKVMAKYAVRKETQFAESDCVRDNQYEDDADWKKAIRFADAAQKAVYESYLEHVCRRRNEKAENERIAKEEARIDKILSQAQQMYGSAGKVEEYIRIKEELAKISNHPKAQHLSARCDVKMEEIRCNTYDAALGRMQAASCSMDFYEIAHKFESLGGYRDSEKLAKECIEKYKEIRRTECEKEMARQKAEAERLEQQRKIAERNQRIAKEKQKKKTAMLVLTTLLLVAVSLAYVFIFEPMQQYKEADGLLAANSFMEAREIFEKLAEKDYKDSAERIAETYYREAMLRSGQGLYESAMTLFMMAGQYADAQEQLGAAKEMLIQKLTDKGNIEEAYKLMLESYADKTIKSVHEVKGFQPFKVEIDVDAAGRIVLVVVPEHNETPGLGAEVIKAGFDHLIGQNIDTAQIDVKAGVTMTSNAINEALADAAQTSKEHWKDGRKRIEELKDMLGYEDHVYQVTGFQPMKVLVRIDENGKIQKVSVLEHNETPGFGADLIQKGFDKLLGQDILTAKYDLKSGVTMTSNAIQRALMKAADKNGFVVLGTGRVNRSVNIIENLTADGFRSIDTASQGEMLTVINAETDQSGQKWYKVSGFYADRIGYIKADAIDLQDPSVALLNRVYSVKGFQPMEIEIALSKTGNIRSVKVLEHNETPGFGADLIKAGFDDLVGKPVGSAQIDVMAGVTYTSNAINEALRLAASDAGFQGEEETETVIPVSGVGVTNRDANIRISPNAKVIRQVKKGKRLTILESRTDKDGHLWYKVSGFSGEESGYVRDYLLDVELANEEQAQSSSTGQMRKVYEGLGFQPIKAEVTVDDRGKIVSVKVLEHNETPGFGKDLINAGFAYLEGRDIEKAQIDVKAGVTMTSNCINSVLKQAAEDYRMN